MGALSLMIAIVLPATIQTASIGIPDTMFLMVLALIVFGPRRLPEIGRQIGKLMYEFRKVSNDFKFQMEEELRASEEADRQQKLESARQLEASKALTLEAPAHLEASAAPAEPAYSAPMAEITAGAVPENRLAEPAPLSTYDGTTTSTQAAQDVSPLVEPPLAATQSEPAVAGEVRGEPRRFPPQIQPPSSGEPVSAARPFRARSEDIAIPDAETVTESGSNPEQASAISPTAAAVLDEGRIGTEIQPGVAAEVETEREARHA